MSLPKNISYDPWPPLPYADFAATQHLLHMALQAVGKLKLTEPFEPQWSAVPLWLSSPGLTTGPIPYSGGAYEVTADLISHQVECTTSWGDSGHCNLAIMSVAELQKTRRFRSSCANAHFASLRPLGIHEAEHQAFGFSEDC